MTFETFRLLSTGQREFDVLALAGEPEIKTGAGVWLYRRDDGTLVGLVFVQGRLTRIDETKG